MSKWSIVCIVLTVMKAEFKITKSGNKEYSVTIKGELTAQSADSFKSTLAEILRDLDKSRVEISLSAVTAIDVCALQLLFAAGESMSKGRGSLSVVWPENEGVDNLLSRTGFRQIFS